MDSAVVGLVGVAIGSATSFGATWISTRAGASSARDERTATRVYEIRKLLGSAYLDATDALQWLSHQHVEDSVHPNFADGYQLRTEPALVKLRDSKRAIGLVAAMGVRADLSELCMSVAVALNVVDDAWHSTQEYTVKIRNKESSFYDVYRKLFDKSYQRLLDSRQTLTGLDGSDSVAEEVDRGVVQPGSLLYRVRAAIGGPDSGLLARA